MSGIERVMEILEARLTRRLESVRAIRQMLASDPELAKDLRHILAAPETATAAPPADTLNETGGGGKQTHAAKVRAFFAEKENRWHTAGQIARAVGISRGGVAAVLYMTRKNWFEHKPHPKHARMKLWRLREPPSHEAVTKGGES